jgi:dihydrofolate synthase/folylpolyglutamate synthase
MSGAVPPEHDSRASGSAVSEPDYAAAVAALESRGRFGVRLGLRRIRAMLRESGDPQRSFRGALVTGTNGKGSVLALVSSALRAAGYRVGETPKPHLVTYRERLQVDGRPVDPATFARLVADILPVANKVARRLGEPTEFELLTAIVFRWLAEVGVDVAVIEVGLGGRLDATHAWDGGVAVITNVDLDHMDRLGPTIAHIAREKAAIIERGDVAVTGASGEALRIIRRRARRMGAPLTEVEPARIVEIGRDGLVVDLAGLGPSFIGLRGRHQAANAAVAHATLDALQAAGIARVPGEARVAGYRTVSWPGRLELIRADGREVLLDGAHNPAGAAALARALDDLRPYLAGGTAAPDQRPPITLLIAVMRDKDVAGMVAALGRSEALIDARIICTRLAYPRAMPAEQLAGAWARVGGRWTIIVEPDPPSALERALEGEGRWAGGPVVVAGSLYMVGEVRARLVDDPLLRDPQEAAGSMPSLVSASAR